MKQDSLPRSLPLAAAAGVGRRPAVRAGRLRAPGRASSRRSDTTLRLDAANGALGTSISLEDDLGYDESKSLPILDATWRINPATASSWATCGSPRDSQKTITGEIRFGDQVFPVNANVNSKFDSDVWRLAYGWSFYREGGNELSLLAGPARTNFSTRSSRPPAASSRRRRAHDPAADDRPAGIVGARPEAGASTARRRFFSLEYDDYDGSLVTGARPPPSTASTATSRLGVGYLARTTTTSTSPRAGPAAASTTSSRAR